MNLLVSHRDVFVSPSATSTCRLRRGAIQMPDGPREKAKRSTAFSEFPGPTGKSIACRFGDIALLPRIFPLLPVRRAIQSEFLDPIADLVPAQTKEQPRLRLVSPRPPKRLHEEITLDSIEIHAAGREID